MVRLGLAVMMIGVPLGSVFSRRLLFTLLPVGIAMVVVGAMLAPRRGMLRPFRQAVASPIGVVTMALLAWAALSIAWTPFPASSGGRFFKIAATLGLTTLAITLLPQRTRTSNLNLMPLGVALTSLATLAAVLLLPLQPVSPELEANLVERTALSLAVLTWPALGALAVRDRWASAVIVGVLALAAAVVARSPVALAGFAVGALAFALALKAPRRTGAVLAGVLGGAMIAGPALAVLLDRAEGFGIQDVALAAGAWSELVLNEGWRTLTGHGFDAAARGFVTGFVPPDAPPGAGFSLWFDLGIVGVVAGAVVLVLTLMGAATMAAPVCAFMLAGVASILTISTVGGAAYQLWWVTIVCVAAVGFASMVGGQYRSARPAAGPPVRDEPKMRRAP